METKKFTIEPEELPAMPVVVFKALDVIENDYIGISELAKIIACDDAIATKILKLVNSAKYALPQKIIALTKAITLIGLNQTKNIIICISMKNILSSSDDEEIWNHSIRCAVCCEILAKEFKIISPEEAFIIGFLHDIGKTIFNKKDSRLYSKVLDLKKRGYSDIDSEEMYFNLNHADLGAIVANKWEFSDIIVDAIKFHHKPLKSRKIKVAAMVYYANELAKETRERPHFDRDVAIASRIIIDDFYTYREMINEKTEELLLALSRTRSEH